MSPPELSSITIEENGALIWANMNITLTVHWILVKGDFHIGSEDCTFTERAHIRLIGNLVFSSNSFRIDLKKKKMLKIVHCESV